jgi:ubiquinone/menaquinone biosynthesis C-methylase UbiE
MAVALELNAGVDAIPFDSSSEKVRVRQFWERGSCGEAHAVGTDLLDALRAAAAARYSLEPHIATFADFPCGKERDVLEIGVGMGCDHVRWAQSEPRSLSGVDLTERAIAITADHLEGLGLSSQLQTADAEDLPFPDASFDVVYSYGVLHHTPDTPKAVREVYRVLRPNGVAKIMIYHAHSLTGYMLWLRYALLAGRPFRSLADVYAEHLESPGTKAYTTAQARDLFTDYTSTEVHIQLNHGDLLEGLVGQRHGGTLLSLAKRLWPRWLLRRLARRHGLCLMITATK